MLDRHRLLIVVQLLISNYKTQNAVNCFKLSNNNFKAMSSDLLSRWTKFLIRDMIRLMFQFTEVFFPTFKLLVVILRRQYLQRMVSRFWS